MASLRRKPNSKFWIACYTTANGIQVQHSTKVVDRKLAQKIADRYEEAYSKRRSAEQVRKILFAIHEEISGQSLNSVAVEDHFSKWAAAGKATLAPRTQAKYSGVSKQFITYLGPKSADDISMISSSDVTGFRDQLAARLSVGSANIALKIVRAAFADAVRQSLLANNPALQVRVLSARPADRRLRRPFTLDEIRLIYAKADDEWKGIILMGLYTGQRLGDIVRLTWQNVDLDTGQIRLVTRKTGRRQAIPIASRLLLHIENLTAGDDPSAPLFPTALERISKSKNGESGSLSNAFRALLEDAGLIAGRVQDHTKRGRGRSSKRQVSEISFHCLRHTATSLLKNAGVSEVFARELIGHDSEAVSRGYTHIDAEKYRKAIESMPDVLSKSQQGKR